MQFTWANPYRTERTPVFARNIVSTSHPLAAQAGLRMLQKGGNAVDAALAAAAMLTVVEPVSCGLGSDAFAILWDGQELHGLNASGYAPAAWSPDYFRKKYGEESAHRVKRPSHGWDTVTVPGAVAGWGALHGRFGKLSFADILAPAIETAERGVLVAPMVAQKWGAGIASVHNQPGFNEAFVPWGRAPRIGELFTFKDAARTFRILAEQGARAYYEGEVAEAIVRFAQKTGGSLSLDDLRSYSPDWVQTLSMPYGEYSLHELPPNGQGIAALMALGILSNCDLASYPVDSPQAWHLQIEAMKLAFIDVYRHVADPNFMEVSPQNLLDPAYLAERARHINPHKALVPTTVRPYAGGTVYLTAADEVGMMVSFIQSNYMGFGSGVVVPGYGISMQNRGFCFSPDATSPNAIGPRKRPFHTIIPAFLMHQGQPQMSFGVMGGDMQPQGHLQTLIRMLCYGQQPQTACDAPRWKVSTKYELSLEENVSASLKASLQGMGHVLEVIDDPYMDFGAGQFIWKLDGGVGYVAASDSRRDGQAVGY